MVAIQDEHALDCELGSIRTYIHVHVCIIRSGGLHLLVVAVQISEYL